MEEVINYLKEKAKNIDNNLGMYGMAMSDKRRAENIERLKQYLIAIEKLEKDKSETSDSGLNKHFVSGSCTDGKHRRQITEKELKLAAKEVRLERGLIEYIINKVRKMQVNSGNYR